MATLEKLRAVFGGTSDEDTILTASQKLGIPISEIASEVGFNTGGQWSNRFGGSIDNYQAGLYDVGSAATGALGLQGVSSWMGRQREINERQSEFARQAAKEQGAIVSYKDIGGVGDAANYLGGLAVDSLPYLGEAAVGGLLARGAMTGTRAAVSAARELGMPAAVQAGERALGRASLAGAVGASYPSAVGDIMSNQREEAGQTDGAAAALLGVPYAAANAFGLEGAAARARLFRPAVNWFDEATGVRGGLKRAGVTALGTGLQEGAGETFQEVMNQAGRNAVNPKAGYFGPQAMERYLESFVGGAALGGVMGGAGGGWRRSEGYKPPVTDNPLNPTDLLNTQTPGPGTWADLAGPPVAPVTPTPTDPRFTGFGNVDPNSLGDNPYGTFGLVNPRAGGETMWTPAFPEDVLERDVPPVLTADAVGGVGRAQYFDDLGAPQWRGLPQTNDARWAAGQPALPDPGVTSMEPGAQMPLSGADDPGLALARQRYEEQLRAADAQKATAAAVQAKAEEQRKEAERVQGIIGGKIRPGSKVVGMVQELEAQLAAGTIDQSTFESDAALLSNNQFGTVRKNIDARNKEQANAAGAGTDGAARPADVGRGAGDQRAPGQPGGVRPAGVQPAAQGVAGAGAAELGSAGGRGDGALRPEAHPIVDRLDAHLQSGLIDQETYATERRIANSGDVGLQAVQSRIQAREAEAEVKRQKKAEATPEDQNNFVDSFSASVQELDPLEQAYVARWLGVDFDEDGNLSARDGGPESLTTMAKSLGISRQAVHQKVKAALDRMGLPRGMRPAQLYERLGLRAAKSDLETLERSVDGAVGEDGGPDDPGVLDEVAGEKAVRQGREVVGTEVVTKPGKDVAYDRRNAGQEEMREIPDQDPVGRQREPEGTIDEASLDPGEQIGESRALTLDSALEGDVSVGRVTADDIAEAQYFYEQNRQRGMAPWGRMGVPQRAELVRMYARARLAGDPAVLATKKALYEDAQRTDGRGGSAADPGATRGAEGRPADGEDLAVAEGVQGDRGVGAEVSAARGPVSVVTKRKRRVVQPERADEDVSWGNQLASAEEGGAALDRAETTKTTRERVLAQAPFAKAADMLRGLGLGHMLDWVGEWRTAGDRGPEVADGWIEGYGSQYVLTIKDASALGSTANASWVMLHELGHAADLAPSGGVYSAHPDIKFDVVNGRVEGRGAVAAELAELYENDPWWSTMLAYPMDARQYGVTDGETVQGETFAQLFAMYVNPNGRAKLQLDAPLAFQFIQESVNDIQATRPLRVRTPGEVKGRAQAFARRYRGVSSGQPGGAAAQRGGQGDAAALRSARSSAADQVAALQQVTDKLPQPAKNAWTDIKDFTARKMPYVMTTFQIFEQFGSKLTRLGDMLRANDLMRQESLSLQMKIDEIVKRWDKLPKAAGELLTDVATRATMLGAYPEKAWADKDNAHVPRERQAEYEELRRLYERMKSTSPEALKLYHETLDAFEAQREQLEAATKRMFDQYGKVMPKPKRTPGPYFPLVRRGDYLAIGESPRLVALKKRLEQAQEADADEATITDLNEQIDQLEKDDQHFWVSSHEKRSGMEQALKEYERRGLVARRSLASQRLDGLPTRNIHSTIAALTAEATKNLSKDGAKEVGNALAEILLRSLPEGHALERQASRRNISGAMQDMKRAVAVAGRQNAYYIARLNHAKEVSDALFEMGRDVKGDINLQHVHRELEQRHALNMQWHETPIQDAIGKAGWMWYLGASPMFLMMNAAQPWLVSAPVMAGQYGASAASRELSRATADALAVLKKARWTGGKFDLWSGIDPDTIQSRFKSRNAKGEEIGEDRKAVRDLILRGVIDEGLSPELAMYAESGGTGMLTKLSRFVSWPSQQIELVNRVATALAAFRLERGVTKAGETAEQAYERALEKAYATVVNTHVDYGAENAPRAMREGGGIPLAKLIFQFRRYQQAMLYLLASNVKKLRDPNEQKVARATLAYLAITSGMAGGAIGLPLAGTAMFLADLFGDDDDEDGDTRTQLRNALRDLTGDKTTADVLAKGLPALFGFDIAERVGMGQVGQLFPRLDLSRSKTAEDKVAKTLLAVAGPGAGLAVQGMDAASFFGAGDFWRGTERLFPKMVADLMRAGREGLTGVEDRKGEMLLSPEERSIGDTIRRALGASSVRESDRFAADKALKDVERGMNARRDRIHTEFRRALRSGDFEDVREMIDEYNADHPDSPIKPKDELAWRKEAQRAGRERDPETGLKVTRRQQPLAEVQRFAQP